MTNRSSLVGNTLLLEEIIECSKETSFEPDAIHLPKDNRAPESPNPACVVCGQENPRGLHLQFAAKSNAAVAQWIASDGWESFRGVIHGGVICAVLDEAMSQAILSAGYSALTAEIRVRFRNKVSVNDDLCVRGWVVSVRKRKIVAESSLTSVDGVEMAHAYATFLTARRS
jgi:hypothetical protein